MTFLQYKKLVLSYWGEDGARMLYIDPLMLFIATCNQQESRKLKAQPLKFDVIKASHFYVSFNYSCLRWPNFFFNSCTIIIFTQTELALCDSALKKRSDSFYVTIILWIYRPCCNCVITYQRWLMSMRWEVKLVRVKNRTGARREGQVSCERKQGGWLIQPSEKKNLSYGVVIKLEGQDIMALQSFNTLIAGLPCPCQTDCFIKRLCLVPSLHLVLGLSHGTKEDTQKSLLLLWLDWGGDISKPRRHIPHSWILQFEKFRFLNDSTLLCLFLEAALTITENGNTNAFSSSMQAWVSWIGTIPIKRIKEHFELNVQIAFSLTVSIKCLTNW